MGKKDPWIKDKEEIKSYLGGFPGGAVVKNRLPTQGTWVRALVWEDPTCRGATACVPQLLSLHSRARKPQLLSPHATTTEAHGTRARALQQEKPPQ